MFSVNLLYSAIYCRSLLLHNNATVYCCLYFCCCFCKKENGLGLFRFCVSMHFKMFVRDFNCIDSRLKHYLYEEENKLKRKMKNELIYPKFSKKKMKISFEMYTKRKAISFSPKSAEYDLFVQFMYVRWMISTHFHLCKVSQQSLSIGCSQLALNKGNNVKRNQKARNRILMYVRELNNSELLYWN